MRALVLLLACAACSRAASVEPPAPRPRFYRNPMNPADTSPVPKKDSMGMDYLPVYAEERTSPVGGLATLQLDDDKRRLLGLKTVAVRRAELSATLRTTGRVAFDETRLYKVQPRFEGFVETLPANFTGKQVRRGEVLATVYSPELYNALQELLLAERSAPLLAQSGLPDAAASTRARLKLLGVDDAAIAATEKSGTPPRTLPITAPASGFITQKNIVAGGKIGPNDALFDIADLSRVWVLADVYEHDLPRVRLHQRATVTLAYWPDRTWSGRVAYVYPTVDEKTRTVKVRVEVDNPRLELKPEMFAQVTLAAAPRRALVVPEDALLDSGERKLVFVSLPDGRLEPRPVETGERSDGLIEIRSGLTEGDQVASGASFLVDSESRLKAALPR